MTSVQDGGRADTYEEARSPFGRGAKALLCANSLQPRRGVGIGRGWQVWKWISVVARKAVS